MTIKEFLWDDAFGLPAPAYDEADVEAKTEVLFKHVFYAYPRVPSPIYASVGI